MAGRAAALFVLDRVQGDLGPSEMKRTRSPRASPSGGVAAVDRYLAPLPADVRLALERLRQTVREAAPGAQEAISYGIPTFRLQGNLVHFAAFRDHCSFFAGSGRLREQFAKELRSLPGTKSCVHFTPDRPLPRHLVRKIVRWRLRENRSRSPA